MTIDLAKAKFTNDLFSAMLPDGSLIVLNKIDEDFQVGSSNCVIKGVNIEIQDVQGNTVSCPCVIGLGNELMKINTDYSEYEGAVLTPDNMMYCTIEIYE